MYFEKSDLTVYCTAITDDLKMPIPMYADLKMQIYTDLKMPKPMYL